MKLVSRMRYIVISYAASRNSILLAEVWKDRLSRWVLAVLSLSLSLLSLVVNPHWPFLPKSRG